jgi:hypothetical protein
MVSYEVTTIILNISTDCFRLEVYWLGLWVTFILLRCILIRFVSLPLADHEPLTVLQIIFLACGLLTVVFSVVVL